MPKYVQKQISNNNFDLFAFFIKIIQYGIIFLLKIWILNFNKKICKKEIIFCHFFYICILNKVL